MAEEGKSKRKALNERLKAKRRAKEIELERMGAGERERCDQDADLTRHEELEVEVCVYYRAMLPMCNRRKTDFLYVRAHRVINVRVGRVRAAVRWRTERRKH